MKKTMAILLSLLVLVACNDENKQEEISTIVVEAYYITADNQNKELIDIGAKVFVYYDFYSLEPANFTYQPDGRLIYQDSIINSEQSAIIAPNGVVRIVPKYNNKKITILVESNYYKGRVAHTSYMSAESDIILKVISRP